MKRSKRKMNEKTIEKIIEYFNQNEDILNDCIEELDSYNGYLGDERYYEMELLNEFYNSTEPLELLYRAFYGYDEGNYITDSYGQKQHREFNPNREYFKYNGYGNLISSDYKDYSDQNDKYLIEELYNNIEEIYTIEQNEELQQLFNEL
jgi:hypothetical protein